MKRSPARNPARARFASPVLFLLLAACGASSPTASGSSPPPLPPTPPAGTAVTVVVSPATTAVDACRSISFAAATTGTATVGVAWAVKEGSAGGSITPAGAYTAPQAAGTYHVVATSVADASAVGEASVVVGPEQVLAVAVAPASATTTPGGSLPLTATVTTSCGTFAAQ